MVRLREKPATTSSPAKPKAKGGVAKKTSPKATTKKAKKGKTPLPPTSEAKNTKKSNPETAKAVQKAKGCFDQGEDKLTPLPESFSSDDLVPTEVPVKRKPRTYWVENYQDLSPPWIVCSHFVPAPLVEFLMRNKQNLAIGVKWQKKGKITNMEGAMHTFVTSIVLAWSHGNKSWDKGHVFTPYPAADKFKTARLVLISNMIHQDFETDEVMMELASLKATRTSCIEDFQVPNIKDKQDDQLREDYDNALRCWMVHHLTAKGELPSLNTASNSALTRKQVREFLFTCVDYQSTEDILETVEDVFFFVEWKKGKKKCKSLLSLEVLVATAFHQFRHELDALEKICPQGYIYTFSPPSIFAQLLEQDELLTLIYAAGLKHYARSAQLKNMRCFALPDISGQHWFKIFSDALDGSGINVISRDVLFNSKETPGDPYNPMHPGTMLVLHNNSDAFGQNIQYETGMGSLDAVVGQYTSAAGSLLRTRADLVERVAFHAK